MTSTETTDGEPALSLKERLKQYQSNARKKKEYEKRQRMKVQQLDADKKDIASFEHAESLKSRKATTVSADEVNRLEASPFFDMDASFTSLSLPEKAEGSSTEDGLTMSFSSIRDDSGEGEVEVRGLFLQALRTTAEEEVAKKPIEVEKPFSDLRVRYLQAITGLTPGERDAAEMDKQERLAVLKGDSHKKDAFLHVREAWDHYEAKASDRPFERTEEDIHVEQKIKYTETEVAEKWSDLAKHVVDDILDTDGGADGENDEEIFELVEGARRMKVENARRQKKKEQAADKREALYLEEKLKDEDNDLLQEALLLREEARQKQGKAKPTYMKTKDDVNDLSDNDKSGSAGSNEWEARWRVEARKQRLAKSADSAGSAEFDENSDDDAPIIEQGKKLRRAYIWQLANEKGSDSESDEDTDVDNIPKWIREARLLRFRSAKKLPKQIEKQGHEKEGGDSNELATECNENGAERESSDVVTGVAREKIQQMDSDSDSSDESSDNGRNSRYLWREEARRLQAEARAKQQTRDNAGRVADGSEQHEDLESESEFEEVIQKAMELEKKFKDRLDARKLSSDSDSESDNEVDRARWLQEARSLKSAGKIDLDSEKEDWLFEARRQRREEAGKVSEDNDDSSDADEEVMLLALQLQKAEEKRCKEGGTSIPDSATSKSRWISEARERRKERKIGMHSDAWMEEARKVRAQAETKIEDAMKTRMSEGTASKDEDDHSLVASAKQLRKERIRERLKFGYGSESEDEADDLDDLAKWIEAARLAREKRLKSQAKHKTDPIENSLESTGREQPAVSRKHKRYEESAKKEKNQSSDSSIMERKTSEQLELDDVVQKAIELEKKFRKKSKSTDNQGSDSESEDEEERAKWLKEARDLKGMSKLKLDSEKQSWLNEARRLREESTPSKAKDASGSIKNNEFSDSNSSDHDEDEEVLLKALRLQKAHERNQGAADTENLSKEMSKSEWIQEARDRKKIKSRQRGKSAWLKEASKLRAAALAQIEEARGMKLVDTVSKKEEERTKFEDEAVVATAKKLRREHIRERLKYGDDSESEEENDEDELDDLAKWIEAAKLVHAKKRQTGTSVSGKRKKKKVYEDSDTDESEEADESRREVFVDEARRLKAQAASAREEKTINGESHAERKATSQKDVSEQGMYDDIVKKAMSLERKYKKRKEQRVAEISSSDEEEVDVSRWIGEAQRRTSEAHRLKELQKAQKDKEKKQKQKRKEAKRLRKGVVVKSAHGSSRNEQQPTRSEEPSERKEEPTKNDSDSGSSVEVDKDAPVSKWILEARKRKEAGLSALKAARAAINKRKTKLIGVVEDATTLGKSGKESQSVNRNAIPKAQKVKPKAEKETKMKPKQVEAAPDDTFSKFAHEEADSDDNDDTSSSATVNSESEIGRKSSKPPAKANRRASASTPLKKEKKTKKEKKKSSKKKKKKKRSDKLSKPSKTNYSDDSYGTSSESETVHTNDESPVIKPSKQAANRPAFSGSLKKTRPALSNSFKKTDLFNDPSYEGDNNHVIAEPVESKMEKSSYSDVSDPSESSTVRSDADDDVAHLFGGNKRISPKKERPNRRASALKLAEAAVDEPRTAAGSTKKVQVTGGALQSTKKSFKSPTKSSKKGLASSSVPITPKKQKGAIAATSPVTPEKAKKEVKKSSDESKTPKKAISHEKATDKATADSSDGEAAKDRAIEAGNKSDEKMETSTAPTEGNEATKTNGLAPTFSHGGTSNENVASVPVKSADTSKQPAQGDEGKSVASKSSSKGWECPLTEWINQAPIKIGGPQIQMAVPAFSSCWRKTRGTGTFDTAPFYFQSMSGNFEVLCKVSADMSRQNDKAGIMIRIDKANWILSGLEYFNGKINNTTCVTLDSTDRSISPLPLGAEKSGIWFCTKRIDATFECFYSLDLKTWIQTRQGLLTKESTVSVGICGASPEGSGFRAKFTYFKCRPMQQPPDK